MMTSFECEYEFDELRVFGVGMMAYGKATLVEDGEEFSVSEIALHDGTKFTRSGTGPLGSEFSRRLFNLMAVEIENSEGAQDFFNEAFANHHTPDEDRAYQEWKDRQLDDQWRDRLRSIANQIGGA
ncbi:hypothetical protein [Sinorhizobium meliloti]|uniref:hypothetical protein n=1 Tax=Rhizobium meliloti TaxID=382 RepID=UPI000B49EFF0|nr:hypothetical protein [Sinorhizobium meliloti]ASP50925.1 hypothetical protein CDO31_04640 [Sinorhizobium meliloti]